MSILTFNISVKDKDFIKTCNEPFQILPIRTGFINVNNYRENFGDNRNILIHTGYDFRYWLSDTKNSASKIWIQLNNYKVLCNKIKADSVLIHGPSSIPEYENITNSYDLFENKDIKQLQNHKLSIEISRFTRDMIEDIRNDHVSFFDFMCEYINKFTKISFSYVGMLDIVFDTAHLYADGLCVDDMIKLFKIYEDYYKYIHLNGNCNPMYAKDEHTIMTNCVEEGRKPNMIGSQEDIDKLLYTVASLNKICISEEKHTNYNYYQSIAKKYGFNLVSEKLCSLSV